MEDWEISSGLLEINLAYLAGLFDGEGHITIARHRSRTGRQRSDRHIMEIGLTNSDYRVLALLSKVFGGNVAPMKYFVNKRCYRWKIQAIQAMDVLEMLLPYLIIKKEQAEIAIAFQKQMRRGKSIKLSESKLIERDGFASRLRIVRGG